MAVFFQDVPEDQFNAESDFVVKESKNMNVFVGLLFLFFSLIAFPTSVIMGGVAFFVAIGALARSTKDTTIIRINKNGFYYYGRLITDWEHFISEQFIDELPLPQGNDPDLTIGSFFSSNIAKRVSPDILEERFALQIHRVNRKKRLLQL